IEELERAAQSEELRPGPRGELEARRGASVACVAGRELPPVQAAPADDRTEQVLALPPDVEEPTAHRPERPLVAHARAAVAPEGVQVQRDLANGVRLVEEG